MTHHHCRIVALAGVMGAVWALNAWALRGTLSPPINDTWIDHSNACTFNPCDASLYAEPNTVFDVSTREDCLRRGNALVRFDLSALPPGSVLAAATLRMYAAYQNEYQTNDFHVSRLLEDWVTTDVDWCERSNGVPWTTIGGTYTTAGQPVASIPNKYGSVPNNGASLAYDEWISWDVTAIVNAWISGSAPNYGFIIWQTPLSGHGRNQDIGFAGKEDPRMPSLAPQIVFDFPVPTQATTWGHVKALYR